jgi:hypothetical protein
MQFCPEKTVTIQMREGRIYTHFQAEIWSESSARTILTLLERGRGHLSIHSDGNYEVNRYDDSTLRRLSKGTSCWPLLVSFLEVYPKRKPHHISKSHYGSGLMNNPGAVDEDLGKLAETGRMLFPWAREEQWKQTVTWSAQIHNILPCISNSSHWIKEHRQLRQNYNHCPSSSNKIAITRKTTIFPGS